VKTESATPPNQRDEAQNRDGVRGNHPFFKTLLAAMVDAGITFPLQHKHQPRTESTHKNKGNSQYGDSKLENIFRGTTCRS
jgi:hypothetical protein